MTRSPAIGSSQVMSLTVSRSALSIPGTPGSTRSYDDKPEPANGWATLMTLIVCWTWGAAAYLRLPAWLASMTQLPTAVKVTVVPDTGHTRRPLAGSTENTTGLPEPPPVADKAAEPPAAPAAGAVQEINWVRFGTVVGGGGGVGKAAARGGEGHRGPGQGAHLRAAGGTNGEHDRVARAAAGGRQGRRAARRPRRRGGVGDQLGWFRPCGVGVVVGGGDL